MGMASETTVARSSAKQECTLSSFGGVDFVMTACGQKPVAVAREKVIATVLTFI